MLDLADKAVEQLLWIWQRICKNLLSELIANLNKLETSKKESIDNYRAEKYSN